MRVLVSCVVLGMVASIEAAGPRDFEHAVVARAVDSGVIRAPVDSVDVAWSTVLRVTDASWIRVTFDDVVLGVAAPGEPATMLRVRSLADDAVQTLDAVALAQWRNTSAYFNGDAVSVELVVHPTAAPSRVVIDGVLAGPPAPDPGDGGIASICGDDDRVPSSDPRVGRVLQAGGTAWLAEGGCMLAAGHILLQGLDVIQFNVPLSNASGVIQHPGPEDQYAVDVTSVQFAWGVVGNDWSHFGCFPNTETGLTPIEAQADAFVLDPDPPAPVGQAVRITGYGIDDSPPEWNKTQQTHAGPYVAVVGSTLEYEVDTDTSNSGSPVVDDVVGVAIGIHTNGGCDGAGGTNKGTGLNNAELQAALAVPQGVCIPPPPLGFVYPASVPTLLDPAGEVVPVEVVPANGGTPAPGTGMLHYDVGDGIVSIPMVEVTPNVYDAVFPAIECATPVLFYFSAQTGGGETVTDPLFAPVLHYDGLASELLDSVFADDFEQDLGWTVENSAGLTGGAWERGVPTGNANLGAPNEDGDGSGQAFVTANGNGNNNVDDGTTTLTSPVMDASLGTPVISYWRWFANSAGGHPFEDVLVVEVSDDAGATWVELETIGPGGTEVHGGWLFRQFLVEDFVAKTNQFRIRFTAADVEFQSVVEAGVDGVTLGTVQCPSTVLGDLDDDGVVATTDFLILLSAWGACPDPCPPSCPADLDGDCSVATTDLLILLANWTL